MYSGRALVLLCLLVFSTAAVAASPATEKGTPVQAGTAYTLASEVYGAPRTVLVRLPWDYGESGRDYPVLYVLDGGARQDFLPMAGMAALAELSAQYRAFIVVGVQTENRYGELTARSEVKEELELIPTCGGAPDFRRHLREEVKPFIGDRFRTSGEDAVIGESLAGLFITETFLREPTLFRHYIAVSPSLWWREDALSREAAELLQAPGFPADRSFFLTVADEGGRMQEAVERVAAALEAHAPAGTRWWYDPMPEEHHNTIYNPATLTALRLVFAVEE